MAAKGVSMRNIDPIPHSKFEEILENSTISVKRAQTNIHKVGENMCTVRINKETINAFENKRWWGDANTSHGYGHPDIKNLPGGSDCNPIRFEQWSKSQMMSISFMQESKMMICMMMVKVVN